MVFLPERKASVRTVVTILKKTEQFQGILIKNVCVWIDIDRLRFKIEKMFIGLINTVVVQL